jgi:hypothetical protein
MRHLYVTLQHHQTIAALLDGDVEALRAPFRRLAHPDCLSWLLDDGAGTISTYEASELAAPRMRLPFVPHLGALRITDKAQVEHRALRHYRGYEELPAEALPSSPTGVRLVPRTEELASRHRLADTYSSRRNAELSRRVAAEGATDYFISQDQSTWHVAISVEPRHRITVEPLTDDAREIVAGVRIVARPYVHIYPYGGLTVTLGVSLVFADETAVGDVIRLVRLLVRRPSAPAFEPAFTFRMRGLEAGPAHDFVGQLASMTVAAIAPDAEPLRSIHLDYALSVGASVEELSDAELSGLLTLDDRYEIFKDDWLEARGSLYGKYGGDRVVASRTGLAVSTSPEHFTPTGRRRFFWRCHAIKELATMQAWVLWQINGRLAAAGTVDGPDEATVQRLMAIGEHLIEFPRGLPAHHRKWFYECQRLVDGVATTDQFYAALVALHHDARHAAMMRRMDDSQSVRITLNNSQVGLLNLGTIVGDVETHLAALDEPGTEKVREALRSLAQAVLNDESLSQERREELIESVDLLAEEAGKVPNRRRGALVRSVLSGLTASLSAAGSLAAVWSAVGPTLVQFFG